MEKSYKKLINEVLWMQVHIKYEQHDVFHEVQGDEECVSETHFSAPSSRNSSIEKDRRPESLNQIGQTEELMFECGENIKNYIKLRWNRVKIEL